MKLSIIVPVYNAEKYLDRLFTSIFRQGLMEDDYEVIVVNDGSSDMSGAICKKYCANHSNFKYFEQNNQGVSIARNTGIDHSNGEYLTFADNDDFFKDLGLSKIFELIDQRQDVDIIQYNSSYYVANDHIVDLTIKDNPQILFDGFARDLICEEGLPAVIWTFLFRRNFINEKRIRFMPYAYGEDVYFMGMCFLQNPHVIKTNLNIYMYFVNEESASGSSKRNAKKMKRHVSDYLSSYENIKEQMSISFGEDKEVIDKCIAVINSRKSTCYSRILSCSLNKTDFEAVKQRMIDNSFYPIIHWNNQVYTKIVCTICNFIFSNYLLYKPTSSFFTHIFTPLILPVIRKHLVK